MMRFGKTLFTVLVFGSATLFAGETRSKIATNPAFDKMKTLVVSWEGTADEGGKINRSRFS
jgi:hypothetical protein